MKTLMTIVLSTLLLSACATPYVNEYNAAMSTPNKIQQDEFNRPRDITTMSKYDQQRLYNSQHLGVVQDNYDPMKSEQLKQERQEIKRQLGK